MTAIAAGAMLLAVALPALRSIVPANRLQAPLGGSLSGDTARRSLRGRRAAGQRRRAVARREEVMRLGSNLAAELRAGAGWDEALGRAADDGELGRALRQAADRDQALVRLGRREGAEALLALQAVGRLVTQLGAPAATVAEDVAEALRSDALARRSVDVELAAAVATARLLAALPIVGLLMGAALGAAPVQALLGTGAGRACALCALLLEATGVAWCRAIRRRAEPR